MRHQGEYYKVVHPLTALADGIPREILQTGTPSNSCANVILAVANERSKEKCEYISKDEQGLSSSDNFPFLRHLTFCTSLTVG